MSKRGAGKSQSSVVVLHAHLGEAKCKRNATQQQARVQHNNPSRRALATPGQGLMRCTPPPPPGAAGARHDLHGAYKPRGLLVVIAQP